MKVLPLSVTLGHNGQGISPLYSSGVLLLFVCGVLCATAAVSTPSSPAVASSSTSSSSSFTSNSLVRSLKSFVTSRSKSSVTLHSSIRTRTLQFMAYCRGGQDDGYEECSKRVVVIGLMGGIASGKSTVAQVLREECGAVVLNADRMGHAAYEDPRSDGFREIVYEFGEEVLSPRNSTSSGSVEPPTEQSAGGSRSLESPEASNSWTNMVIDRAKLRRKVFGGSDSQTRQRRSKLEAIVWPKIRQKIEARIELAASNVTVAEPGEKNKETSSRVPVVVVEAALLIDAGWADLCDEIWVVRLDESEATERLMRREGHERYARKARQVGGEKNTHSDGASDDGRDSEGNEAEAEQLIAERIRASAPPTGMSAGIAYTVEIDNNGDLKQLRHQVIATWEALLRRI